MESDCFARQKLLLEVIGLSANQNIFYKIYSVTLLTISTIYVISVIPEILKIRDDFDELTYSLFFEASQVTGILSTHYLFWNRSKLQKLFETIGTVKDLSNCANDNGDNVFIYKCESTIKKQSFIGSILLCAIVISQVPISLVLSMDKDEWILPFGSGPNLNNNLRFATQIVMFTILQALIVVELFTYVNMLTFISGHYKQLHNCLITIMTKTDKNSITNEITETKIDDWETFKIKLRKIIPYHVGIIDVADQVEDVFSFFILIIFGGAIGGLCLLIFHGTSANVGYLSSIKDFTLIVMGYMLLILLSVCGEQVITESENVLKVCYDIDFIGADLRIQKALLIVMICAQKSRAPTIGKLKILNLETMLGVFQTIYSYYTFVRNMNSK